MRRRWQVVQPQPVAGDHGKEPGAGPARGPEQVGMLAWRRDDDPSVCEDHLDRLDVCARRAPQARVPTEAAAQDITAQSDMRAVADGEGQAVRLERLEQVAAAHPRADPGRALVHLDAPERREIEQQAIVAQRGRLIAMSAAPRRNLQAVVARKTNRGRGLGLAPDGDDRRRTARVGQSAVPAKRLASLVVAGLAPPQGEDEAIVGCRGRIGFGHSGLTQNLVEQFQHGGP